MKVEVNSLIQFGEVVCVYERLQHEKHYENLEVMEERVSPQLKFPNRPVFDNYVRQLDQEKKEDDEIKAAQ